MDTKAYEELAVAFLKLIESAAAEIPKEFRATVVQATVLALVNQSPDLERAIVAGWLVRR